jgi:hypothetical protein
MRLSVNAFQVCPTANVDNFFTLAIDASTSAWLLLDRRFSAAAAP